MDFSLMQKSLEGSQHQVTMLVEKPQEEHKHTTSLLLDTAVQLIHHMRLA